MNAFWCRVLNFTNCFTKIMVGFFFFFSLIFQPPSLMATTTEHIPTADFDFPSYPSIKPNIDFWIDIFTKYSASQGVIHDTRNLGLIYEVVRLDTSNTIAANRKNKKIKKAVIKKYKTILLNLAKGKKVISKEEKRIATLFGPGAKPSNFKNAAFNIRCQTGLRKQFKDGLIRAGAVIDEFKRIFKSHGLPLDLVYLPCVESSYNFKAYSKFGAAGIWQFTHGTGRQYMKIGYVVDERRDPYISTDAAARLLKKNYSKLRNWPMAITAYNHGLAGMMRAKKSKGSYEKIVQSYRSRSFKFASRNFYSEFLAARIVAKNSEKYFGKFKARKPATFQVVKLKGYLPVAKISEKLKISISEIQTLNPSLRKPVFNGQKYIPKGFRLRLPKTIPLSNANTIFATTFHSKQKPSRFHRVQKGDTAGSIARIHSVKLYDLVLANGLNRRATIYIGQNLRIPVKDEILLAKKNSNVPKSSKKSLEKKNAKVSIVQKKGVKSPSKKLKPRKLENQSEKVETMISSELPAEPIKDETPINPNIVTSNLKVLKTYKKQKLLIGVINVEAEETLGHYADWLQIPTQEIRTLNKFKFGVPISIDQEIKIPMRKKTVQEFEEQRYDFHKEIEEDFFESFLIQGVETYVVKNGDTIWLLCLNELEIPIWLLKKYNPKMKFDSLKLNQKIKYPLINDQKVE